MRSVCHRSPGTDPRSGETRSGITPDHEVEMRRFAGWSEAKLDSEATRKVASVERLLDTFRTRWSPPPHPERLVEYVDHLEVLVERLGSAQRRMEEIADELTLRAHWATIRRVRAMSEEDWRAAPAEFRDHYDAYRR